MLHPGKRHDDSDRADRQHPAPAELIDAVAKNGGNPDDPALEPLFDEAIRDTIARFEATGSPVVTDGEQRKYHNFWDYCVHGLPNMAPDGFKIPFAAGHTRRMPRLTEPPVPLQGARGSLPRGRAALREAPGEAGRDLAVGAEPALSGGGHPRLLARAVHRGPA